MTLRWSATTVLLVTLLAAPVLAQTMANPIREPYEDVYVVAGRVIDGNGNPAAGSRLVVELDQEGATMQPFLTGTNCFGDFVATLAIRYIHPDAKVKLTLQGSAGGVSNATTTVALDNYYRRSDVKLQAEGRWTKECADQQTAYWPGRITVTGRIVNSSEPYQRNGTEYHARPYHGPLGITFWDVNGYPHCPPGPTGGCEVIATDERGDFRYSFTFPTATSAAGRAQVTLTTGNFTAPIDVSTRMATFAIDISGRGPPANDTPAPAVALALGALGLVALALRRR